MGIRCKTIFSSGSDIPADADDAFALAWALTNPTLRVIGVVVGYGNCNLNDEMDGPTGVRAQKVLKEMVKVAQRIISFAGKSIPIWTGAVAPLSVGLPNPFPARVIAEINQKLKQNPGTALVEMGPATTSYWLIQSLPDRSFSKLLMMMGQHGRWMGYSGFYAGASLVADFNFRNDVEAATKLLTPQGRKNIILKFTPFNRIKHELFTHANMLHMRNLQTSVASYFFKGSRAWFDRWTSLFKEAGFHLWDMIEIMGLAPPPDTCAYVREERVRAWVQNAPRADLGINNPLYFKEECTADPKRCQKVPKDVLEKGPFPPSLQLCGQNCNATPPENITEYSNFTVADVPTGCKYKRDWDSIFARQAYEAVKKLSGINVTKARWRGAVRAIQVDRTLRELSSSSRTSPRKSNSHSVNVQRN